MASCCIATVARTSTNHASRITTFLDITMVYGIRTTCDARDGIKRGLDKRDQQRYRYFFVVQPRRIWLPFDVINGKCVACSLPLQCAQRLQLCGSRNSQYSFLGAVFLWRTWLCWGSQILQRSIISGDRRQEEEVMALSRMLYERGPSSYCFSITHPNVKIVSA